MISPLTLQYNVVNLLRAIPDLVTELGGDIKDIQGYDDESQVGGNPDIAANSMLGKAVLVAWTGAELPREGDTRGWTHSFKVVIKAESVQSYFRIARLIMDGVPNISTLLFDDIEGDFDDIPGTFESDGVTSFLNSEIHPLCDGIQNAEITPERGDDGVGRLSITFTITER